MPDDSRPYPPTGSRIRAYGLAVVFVAAGAVLTRLAWRMLSGTPFVPLFGSIVAATHWGNRRAGQFAIVLAMLASRLAVPPGGPSPWAPRSLIVFAAVGLLANLVVDGRNRVEAALRASLAAQRQAEEELRASEEHLRRAQKSEAVGRLVAGLAHNFSNLLTVVMGHAELVLRQSDGREPYRSDLEQIRSAAARGAVLTRQLLAAGRNTDAAIDRIDIMAAVAGLRGSLARAIREDIRLTIDVAREPAAIEIDPNDLRQIVQNLVLNARDALPEGGTIAVEVARHRFEAAALAQGQSVAAGEYARLKVRDDGVGMTPDVEARLFELFFTTKEVDKGTGLGLAFVHGIARQAGGFVTVETAPGQGTTVAASFPLAPVAEPTTAVSER